MISIIEFDFAAKTDRKLEIGALAGGMDTSKYYWIDILDNGMENAEGFLRRLEIPEKAVDGIVGPERDRRHDIYPNGLHFSLTEMLFGPNLSSRSHVNLFVSERLLLTYHKTPTAFVDSVRLHYSDDFHTFAKSPGFLLYEVAENLVESCRMSASYFENEAQNLHAELLDDPDDGIFQRTGRLMCLIRQFRIIVQSSREILDTLSSRKYLFVSETTQPFLQGKALCMERINNDMSSELTFLSDTLNLYIGMVGHKTNRVVNRLTAISLIFLPLTFICGVYGMNFKIPETRWVYSYAVFWVLCITVVSGLLVMMKRNKWI